MTENITLNDHVIAHCNESIAMALSVERHPLWARSCPEMSDIDFTYFGLLRCIDNVDSGRHFLQKEGGFVNPLFFQSRIVRLSSYTIRAVQNAIVTGKSLAWIMDALIARLVSRVERIVEHRCHKCITSGCS